VPEKLAPGAETDRRRLRSRLPASAAKQLDAVSGHLHRRGASPDDKDATGVSRRQRKQALVGLVEISNRLDGEEEILRHLRRDFQTLGVNATAKIAGEEIVIQGSAGLQPNVVIIRVDGNQAVLMERAAPGFGHFPDREADLLRLVATEETGAHAGVVVKGPRGNDVHRPAPAGKLFEML
jgi:hypothetical protein